MVIETRSPEETFAVGKSLGEKAFPGQVLTLTGDLGVGKTVFTQGLAEGLGIEEPVNSPGCIQWRRLLHRIQEVQPQLCERPLDQCRISG